MKMTRFEEKAKQLDENDALQHLREFFLLPPNKIYLCNNSLGLPAKSNLSLIQQHLQKWSDWGAHGWFSDNDNWYSSLDKPLREPLSKLLGAHFDEVVVMNSLTINLHLLLISFYQPTSTRFKIVIDAPTFPSDLYAIKSHLMNHGLDPEHSLIILKPRQNENTLREEDIKKILTEKGHQIALVFLNSVNYLTGQVLDMDEIITLSHQQGCLVGFDLAHAAGNIPLHLHDQQVDFAVGCSYKYLCSGPGGPGFAFVHSIHHQKKLPRLCGWWGNDPNSRFQMNTQMEFIPYGGAASWQVSCSPILALLPFIASLEIYDKAGMTNLRNKSKDQTTFLLEMLDELAEKFSIITPLNVDKRGSQISLQIHDNPQFYLQKLLENNFICDFRPPNIIRITPSPLYTSFKEIYLFSSCLLDLMK